MNPYHEGIEARKDNMMRCENPYRGTLTFSDTLTLTPKWHKREAWDQGWDAADVEINATKKVNT